MFERYITYLKDNPKGYWFRRKLYGWGWTPARPQGWLTLVLYLVLVLVSAYSWGESQPERFLALFVLATIILLLVCYLKGESPRWQWGIDKSDQVDIDSK